MPVVRSALVCSALIAALSLSGAGGALAAKGAARDFSEDDVIAAVRKLVDERTRGGTFTFRDPRSGGDVALVLDDVRIVRGLPGYGWFPNVVFHVPQVPAKKYALDFWLKPQGETLKLMDVRIHKLPQRDGASWMSITRAPLAWWWLPTIERASAVAGMQAWQVMGAIHTEIVQARQGEATVITDADGKSLSLQLIDVEQPVGKSKADGRYFACVEFRKFGTPAAFYSTAYWLDAKTNLVSAGRVKEVSETRGGEGKAAAEPRCDVGPITYDIVD